MSEPVPPRRTLRTVLLVLAGVLLLSLGTWMTVPPVPPPQDGEAPQPRANSLPLVRDIGGEFRLPATTGRELALSDLRGKVVLLNFGFTHCPDVCPTVLMRMGGALQELALQGADMSRVQPLFVTFDPERDTLDHLREYVAFFHRSFIGLRGDDEQVRDVARQYKVIYLRQDTQSAAGYVFQHSDFVYVIDAWGRVRLLVGSKDPEAALVEAVKKLLAE
ncbi:MAG: SCO family protein [Gammaproteobacteria bacterium]